MGPSVINFDTPRQLSTPISTLSGAKRASAAWMSSHPSDSLSDLEALYEAKVAL